MKRRTLLGSACLAAMLPLGRVAFGESSLGVRDIDVGGADAPARRARLFIPNEASARRRVLVLLHGKGETVSERLGLRAWPELYGLIESDARLRQGRMAPTLEPGEVAYTSPQVMEQLQRALDDSPYRGMAFVCPVTPDPSRHASRAQFHASYAAWLVDELLPAVRAELPEARSFALDGCSMGGPIALETFLARPEAFAQVGMIQGAIGATRAVTYADRLKEVAARSGPKPIHLLTSSSDPFRPGNERLHRELSQRGIPPDLAIPRGPHNQPFLRQIGTALLLRWHDAHLPR